MIVPSIKEMKALYKDGNLKEVAKWLPHLRYKKSKFIKFLVESNILRMKEHINDTAITLGADPEFILCEKGKEDNVVLFSSMMTSYYFGLSEAEMGSDYGLMEFRPPPEESAEELVKRLDDLHKEFEKSYSDCCYGKFQILEKEAVEYNHKRARVLESLKEEEDINYGMNRGKELGVWVPGGEEMVIGQETGTSLSAYDKPSFNRFNDELFTAGGHIHIGGAYIMMLSFEQLRDFVRKLDEEILPMCVEVETKNGELRRTVYGSVGEFRVKEYGIEYRSPSNAIFWKKNSKKLLKVLGMVTDIVRTMAL